RSASESGTPAAGAGGYGRQRDSEGNAMHIVRFMSGGNEYLGRQEDAATAFRIDGRLLDNPGGWAVTTEQLPIDKLLAPLVPTDILCIGLNYREHAAESGSGIPENPVLFIKAS